MKNRLLLLFTLCAAAMAVAAQPKKIGRQDSDVSLPQPVVKPATNITSDAFTANWETVPGAEGYAAYVYRKDTAPNDGLYILVDEGFDGIDFGSVIEPGGGDESYVDLSAEGYALGPGWAAYAFPNFIRGMVAGKIYSPEIDLDKDDGHYQLVITTYSSDGDEILIESHGAGEMVRKVYKTHVEYGGAGVTTDTIDFDNGCPHLYFSVINQTAEVGTADYFDRIQVIQRLKAGEQVYTLVDQDDAIEAETEWGNQVTNKRFTGVTAKAGVAEVYYQLYASAYNFGYDEDGKFTYHYVYSPYSDYVKVDLQNRTSEVVTGIRLVEDNSRQDDDHYYTLAGQRIDRPSRGVFVHNGRKVVVK